MLKIAHYADEGNGVNVNLTPLDVPRHAKYYPNPRGIAQSGSAPALGAGCRGFESLCPDNFLYPLALNLGCI